jgi:hypothetical protein
VPQFGQWLGFVFGGDRVVVELVSLWEIGLFFGELFLIEGLEESLR